MTRPSPKLDALRAMREAQFTGRARSRPDVAALREAITTPAAPASTEDDMAKRKAAKRAKGKKAVKAKTKRAAAPAKPKGHPRKAKTSPLTPGEHALRDYLLTPKSRPEINAHFGWSDHTARATLARVKAKTGGAITKSKQNGVNYYVATPA